MKPTLILYASRRGQTRRIAEYLGDALEARNVEVEVMAVNRLPPDFSLGAFGAAILASPVHMTKHESKLCAFVKAHRDELLRLPTAFLSVSLSQAGAEDAHRTPEQRARSAAEVQGVIERFCADTQWRPGRVLPVAGALPYRQYGPILRFIMRRISSANGGPTDTSRNHDLTDWQAVESFADELTTLLMSDVPATAPYGRRAL